MPLKIGIDYSKVYHYNKTSALFEKYDSSTQEFTTLKAGESYYIYLLKDTTWEINNVKPTTTFTYDGDGGRVAKEIRGSDDQVISKTTYIGSLYEVDSDSKTRKHIFAGSNRIATVEPTNTFYSHSDHLGSSNVITDKDGNQVGFTEFTPYGSTFKQAGSYDPRHKFTGKELDDTTGLYFFSARYYDPQIGRFITADPTIQNPYDPQDLNRYSYCRNNPINLIDPSGLGWKKFWKKVWHAIKAPFIALFMAAAIVFTWGAIAPTMTAMGALFCKTGAVIVSSAAASTAALDTGEGRQFIRRLGKEVFDDIFGMKPSVARMFGTIGAYMLANMAFQFGFARLYGANKAITEVKDYDPTKDKVTTETILKEGKGINYGSRPEINSKTGELEKIDKLYYSGEETVGVGSEALNLAGKPEHIGIILRESTMQSDMASFFRNPFKALSQGYLTFGISHQAVNTSLLNAGYSTTIMGLGGGHTTAISTFVYGPYGGGLTGAVTYERTRNK